MQLLTANMVLSKGYQWGRKPIGYFNILKTNYAVPEKICGTLINQSH